MTPWRPAAMALAMLGLAWLAWIGAGWLVARFGLPAGALLQQATLLALFLTLVDRLAARFFPPAPSGDHHG